MDIHNAVGAVAEPLATLEQLNPEAKNVLNQTARTVVQQASFRQRAGWWLNAHPGQTVAIAFAIGGLTAFALAALVNEIRE